MVLAVLVGLCYMANQVPVSRLGGVHPLCHLRESFNTLLANGDEEMLFPVAQDVWFRLIWKSGCRLRLNHSSAHEQP